MTRTAWLAALGLLSWLNAVAPLLGQSGPDTDADGAPGYVDSVFHQGQVDSVNMYNGQLTIPLAVGPSYPVGPKLRVQVTLSYNSRSTDYGGPSIGEQSNFFFFKPLVGNPSLGSGWELTLGAIKACKHGAVVGYCYSAPDGSQHMFGSGPRASDASQLYLSGTGPFDMWDGDGNHYVFGTNQHVTGYDDSGLPEGYTHDFGRGRDGWYLTSVTDPFGNRYSITYYGTSEVTTPQWTYGTPLHPCPAHTTAIMKMRTPAGTGTWIPKDITLPSGSKIHFNTGSILGVSGMITSVDFPEFVDGASATKTWTLGYETSFATLSHGCGQDAQGNPMTVLANVPRLRSLTLPADDSAAPPSYKFSSSAAYSQVLLDQVTLPTGGAIQYCYSNYTMFHGRGGKLEPGCPGMTPPANDPDNVVVESLACSLATPEDAAPEIPGGCTESDSTRWIDTQAGVVRRREIVGSVQSDTIFKQYAFPFGELGNSDSPGNSETLTVAVFPGTDENGDAGRRRGKAILFSSTRGTSGNNIEIASVPGDVVGGELEERVFETDPTTGTLQDPPCGGATDSAFCGSKAVRVVQKTYEVDTTGLPGSNRRLQEEKTIYGASSCGTCPYHDVAFTLTGTDTWEGNGRHYNIETHTGSLGGDSKTITTDWAPFNWVSGPSGNQPVLPNLFNQRTTVQGSSTRDEYFDFEIATVNRYGFLKGSFVYDSVNDIAFINCRYDDGAGNVDKELTTTLSTASPPARTYCSTHYATFPDPIPATLAGDMFGKDYTWRNGELLKARWINGSVGTATFNFLDYTRDATTGWVTSSKDTSGLQTTYTYDNLGRVHTITPPAAGELTTFLCYEGPGATTAYRASTKQLCPVASSNLTTTWQHFEYDGLARLVRERRLQPAASVVKRFTLYDRPGNAYFTSEWVPDATSESITPDLATSCAFSGTNLTGRGRPSAAPGTYRLCYDPFGRPQQVVGAKMSSLVTIDRSDGSGNIYSDTREAALTYCLNATFSNLTTAACSAGGINATTTTQKDAFGRITRVTEPSGDVTTHTYDVNGKLLTVTQGAQSRTFTYDTNGFLRSESTPERGAVTYNTIGSLGNVRVETQPGSLVISRTFDFAGRLTEEDIPSGTKYVVNCFDGAATCVDGSTGFAGGSYPAGKLTRRYGYNWIPTIGPVVDEQFTYSDSGGRLSQLKTIVGNGDLGGTSQASTQSWTYGNLGLVGMHNHPRVSGSLPVTYTYSNGLPTAVTAGLTGLVTAATYNPAAGLASWTSNTAPTAVITTITQDASMLPRPTRIVSKKGSTPLFDTGTYSYDGAGNVLAENDPTNGGTFTYDNRARILSATYGASTKNFTYDRWANLLSNGTLTFQMDTSLNNNHLKVGGSTTAVSYDGRGSLTTYNADTMSYDSLDRLYRNQSGSSDFVFLHNGAGERLVKFPGNISVARREMARLVGEANKAAGKTGWTTAPDACLGTFSDVPCTTDADAGWIQTVFDHGTSAGCGSGLFCPDPPSGSLTRAQMAVFIVKGYRADRAATPPCTGIFADVSCSTGPWASYAPYIEQLSRDNVTAGCGGNNFCPGNPVTPWQILVWMSKAPAVPGGVAWGTVYHPVPRGSIYTLRDEQNRVVTEMTDALSGSASATLSVTRDNVFFGSLLVASANGSGIWNFDVSDHLGSVRTLWDGTGTVTETHKYWPYGEDTNTTVPNQHLTFQQMERNDGVAQHYDHARNQHYNLGRFLCPDKIGGYARNPQSWNRYAYASNNPLKMVDRNGLWSTSVHNEIINKAFPGLSSQQRQILMRASSRMDNPALGGQNPGRSYEHAMRGPGETADQARQKAIGFYEKNINEAKALQERSGSKDLDPKALSALGNALHTTSDATSPAHAGFQLWNPVGTPLDSTIVHPAGESSINPNEMNMAVQMERAAFAEAFGTEAAEKAATPPPPPDPCQQSPQNCPGHDPVQ